jgi:large subunit ribosomal protein L28
MAKCAHCGKIPQFGNSRSHSLKATRRQFKANLQTTTILQGGVAKRIVLCTRCIRTLAKAAS